MAEPGFEANLAGAREIERKRAQQFIVPFLRCRDSEPATEITDRVRAFGWGSEYADWEAANCSDCLKTERLGDANVYVPSQCEIQRALADGFWGDGRIDAVLYRRSGLPGNRCPERELPELQRPCPACERRK